MLHSVSQVNYGIYLCHRGPIYSEEYDTIRDDLDKGGRGLLHHQDSHRNNGELGMATTTGKMERKNINKIIVFYHILRELIDVEPKGLGVECDADY